MPGQPGPQQDRVGDVINGWALKIYTTDGPVHVFGEHNPEKLKR